MPRSRMKRPKNYSIGHKDRHGLPYGHIDGSQDFPMIVPSMRNWSEKYIDKSSLDVMTIIVRPGSCEGATRT